MEPKIVIRNIGGLEVKSIEKKVGCLTLSFSEFGTFTVIGCDKDVTHVEVPRVVDDATCVGIQAYAFADCISLKSIELPQFDFNEWLKCSSHTFGILGKGAFKNCKSLEKIVLPSGVQYLYPEAFAGCTSLKSITRGKGAFTLSLTIKVGALDGCLYLEELPEDIDCTDDARRTCISLKPRTQEGDGFYINSEPVSDIIPADAVEIASPGYYAINRVISVTFEDTNGWYVKFKPELAPYDELPLDVSCPERNARILKNSIYDRAFEKIYKKI